MLGLFIVLMRNYASQQSSFDHPSVGWVLTVSRPQTRIESPLYFFSRLVAKVASGVLGTLLKE